MALSKIFSNSFKPNLLINSSGSSFSGKKTNFNFLFNFSFGRYFSKTLSVAFLPARSPSKIRNASSTILKIILIWSSVSAVPREATDG